MELEKQTLTCLRPVLRRRLLQEETAEAIVPDISPDVERILWVTGQPLLRGKECRTGSVSITGGIRATVLYLPQGETLPRSLELYLPFVTKAEDPALSMEDQPICELWLRSMDARLINSRKVLVRANLAVNLTLWSKAEEQLCTGVQPEDGLEVKIGSYPLIVPVTASEKSFTLTDTLELPAGAPRMEELLCWQLLPELTESNLLPERGILKGRAALQFLYRTPENELGTWNTELAISQLLDLPGAQEGDELSAILTATGAELEPESPSRLRYTVQLLAQGVVSAHKTVSLLEDLYSTHCPVELKRSPLGLENRLDRQLQFQSLRQRVPADAAQVLGTQVLLDVPALQRQGEGLEMTADAVVSLLYRDTAGKLQGVTGRMKAETETKLAEGCQCQGSARPTGEIYAAPGAEGLEVRFGVTFELCCYGAQGLETISELRELEPDAQAQDCPSVILRRVRGDETLWDIAKANHTTVQAICQANDLSGGEVPAGRLLLIPQAC